MYILDKNKDYYDYLSGIYGIDKSITFDRRGSIPMNDIGIAHVVLPSILMDRQKKERHLLLEVGNIQFVFEVEIYGRESAVWGWEPVYISTKHVCTFRDNKNYSGKGVAFIPATSNYHFSWKDRRKEKQINNISDLSLSLNRAVSLPILKNTFVPAHIPAEEIWKELSNFISAKRDDKDIDIVNSDVDKATNHGFDKKSSFRHPIKL